MKKPIIRDGKILPTRDEQIYNSWCSVYENTRKLFQTAPKKARGDAEGKRKAGANRKAQKVATGIVAGQFFGDGSNASYRRRVQQIVAAGRKFRRTVAARTEPLAKEMNSRVQSFRQMHAVIEQAAAVLRGPVYRDLLGSCAMETRFGPALPTALRLFSSDKDAISADSVQRLASVLARAFLRAHEASVAAESKRNQTQGAANLLYPEYSGRRRINETKRPPPR